MKTRELIAKLQGLDPSGELEVIADGAPVYFIERLPAYYDGSLPMLVEDPELVDVCFSVVGFKYTSQGEKIRLGTVGLDDFLLDLPDGPVDLSEVNNPEWLAGHVEKTRQRMRDVHRKVNAEHALKGGP